MNRSFTFNKGRSRAILAGVCLVIFVVSLSAQVTSVKLPRADSLASFQVQDNGSATLLRLNGDGGFYVGGTAATGVIPVEGYGARLMWYPAKAAFRAGHTAKAGTEWDDANVGVYSTAMGNGTIASGISSTAMGNGTIASGSSSTAMGYQAVASGNYSTAMGAVTMANGDASTAMGAYVSTAGYAGSFIIGDGGGLGMTNSSAANQMTMRFNGGYRLFTNSATTVGVSLATGANSWAVISDSTKKANFLKADHDYFLSSLAKLKLGSWNYKAQNADAKQYRHYGPMAQEIYHYFGNDGKGTIGCDTLLASADMDGIMMVCLQALEKRTGELQKANDKIAALQSSFDEMKTEMLSMKNEIKSLASAQAGKAQEKIALNTSSKGQ